MASEDADQMAARIAQKLRDAGGSAILYPRTATTLGALRRDRVVVVVSLTLLAALAWSYLLWLSVDMGMGGMDMTGFRMIPAGTRLMMPVHTPWRAMEFAFVFAMWTVMMVGMMTPSAMPMILDVRPCGPIRRAAEHTTCCNCLVRCRLFPCMGRFRPARHPSAMDA